MECDESVTKRQTSKDSVQACSDLAHVVLVLVCVVSLLSLSTLVSMRVLKVYLSLYTLLRSHLFVNCCIRRYSLYSNCAARSRHSCCPDVCRDEAPTHSEQPGVSPYLWMTDFEMYFFLFSVIGSPVNSLGFLDTPARFENAFLLPLFSRRAPLKQPFDVLVRVTQGSFRGLARIQLSDFTTHMLGIHCLTFLH